MRVARANFQLVFFICSIVPLWVNSPSSPAAGAFLGTNVGQGAAMAISEYRRYCTVVHKKSGGYKNRQKPHAAVKRQNPKGDEHCTQSYRLFQFCAHRYLLPPTLRPLLSR